MKSNTGPNFYALLREGLGTTQLWPILMQLDYSLLLKARLIDVFVSVHFKSVPKKQSDKTELKNVINQISQFYKSRVNQIELQVLYNIIKKA